MPRLRAEVPTRKTETACDFQNVDLQTAALMRIADRAVSALHVRCGVGPDSVFSCGLVSLAA